MWKWTDGKNIKCILLDVDSLNEEYLSFEYQEIIKNVSVQKVTKMDFSFSLKESVYEEDQLIHYIDGFALIPYIIGKVNINSMELIVVSSDITVIKEFINLRIGTIYTSGVSRDVLKNIPDYYCNSIQSLEEILCNKKRDYASESIWITNNTQGKALIRCNIKISDDDYFQLVSGGRYYPSKNAYYSQDLLSNGLLSFKNKYNKLIDQYYDRAIIAVHQWIRSVDIVTFVPQKPTDIENERFDRFKSLELVSVHKNHISVFGLFECIKDYVQKQNNSEQRIEAVKNAFRLINEIDTSGKHIVILDDLFVTGATVTALAKLLYENSDAAHPPQITVITLAVNQTVSNPTIPYKNLTCPKCGEPMKIRFNNTGLQQAFFGCSSFPRCKETIDIPTGLNKIKINNIMDSSYTEGFDDSYM